MSEIEKLREIFPEVKTLTYLEVPPDSLLVVHVDKDHASREVCESIQRCFDHFRIGVPVLVDDVGCTFSAIKAGEPR